MTKPRAHDTSGRTCHSKTRVYVFLGVTSGKELGFDRQWHVESSRGSCPSASQFHGRNFEVDRFSSCSHSVDCTSLKLALMN